MPPQGPNLYNQTQAGPINFANQGYGPINYQNRAPDPFSQLDDYINYQNMVRQQEVEQYQQTIQLPLQMTQKQLFQAVNYPRFQFGVDATARETMYRTYQRRNNMQREQYASRLGVEAIQWGATSLTFGIGAGIGGGILGGIAGGLVGGALLAPLGMAVEGELGRREFAANISTDLDLYRRKIGGNFTYQQNTQLGRQLQREMYRGQYQTPEQRRNEFFTPEQQMGIFKTGISTGLLDAKNLDVETMLAARGGRMDQGVVQAMQRGGTTQQFQRNFEMLRDTTRDVVKLLQTTVEGGMSVIKELQQTGFRSIGDIRNQVIQAKAFGDITGVGAQNMMQIGRAGAQAVQGTGWSAQAGAQMFQQAATTAALQAQVSPAMARAVERAGGIGQAGAALATAQLNMLNSGMGTRVVAAMLRPNGTIDVQAMNRMRSGQMSAFEITSRSGQVGYAMGPGGRAMFDLTRQRALEQMTDIDRQMLVQKSFDAWRGNKMGNAEQQAYVYAGMWTNDPTQRELMMNNLLMSKQYDVQWGALQAQRGAINAPARTPYQNYISRRLSGAMAATGRASAAFGETFVEGASLFLGTPINKLARLGVGMGRGFINALEMLPGGTYSAEYGAANLSRQISPEALYQNIYGVNRRVTGQEQAAINDLSPIQLSGLTSKYGITQLKDSELQKMGMNLGKIFTSIDASKFQGLQERMSAYSTGALNPAELLRSRGTAGDLALMGIRKDSALFKRMESDPNFLKQFVSTASATWANMYTSRESDRIASDAKYQTFMKDRKDQAQLITGVNKVVADFVRSGYDPSKSVSELTTEIMSNKSYNLPPELAGKAAAILQGQADKGKFVAAANLIGGGLNIGATEKNIAAQMRRTEVTLGIRERTGFLGRAWATVLAATPGQYGRSMGTLRSAGRFEVSRQGLGGEMFLGLAREFGGDRETVLRGLQNLRLAGEGAVGNPVDWINADSTVNKKILAAFKGKNKTMTDLEAFNSAMNFAQKMGPALDETILAYNEKYAAKGWDTAAKQAAIQTGYFNQTRSKLGIATERDMQALTYLNAGIADPARLREIYSTKDKTGKVTGVDTTAVDRLGKMIREMTGASGERINVLDPKGAAAAAAILTGQDKTGLLAQAQKAIERSKLEEEYTRLVSGKAGQEIIRGKVWEYSTGEKDKEGKTVMTKINYAEMKEKRDELQAKMYLTKEGASATPTGEMSASVAPPVLNYWNNRWIL